MARDPLAVLLVLRQRFVDQQRQALAACLVAETAAGNTVRLLDAAMERDRDVADGVPEHLQFRDIFIATRQHLRGQRETAVTCLAGARNRSDQARENLAGARLAAEAVERLIKERTLAARAEADRRAQHELDDIARAGRKPA
jgi:flagellar biosynthesis chaperone FliJ